MIYLKKDIDKCEFESKYVFLLTHISNENRIVQLKFYIDTDAAS
jgi:hypothetical protein